MTRSRTVLHVGLALACVAELLVFVSLLKSPEPAPAAPALALEDTLDVGEELVSRDAPAQGPDVAVAALPAHPGLRLVTARVTVDAAGDIATNIEPGAWVERCPEFAPRDVLQVRNQMSLAEGSGALVAQRTACVSVQAGEEGETRIVPDTSRLIATDTVFEGSVQARAWRFSTGPGQAREIRAAGLFWCPEELEDSDTCFASVSLELSEPSAPLLVPVKLPGRGSSAVSLSPR